MQAICIITTAYISDNPRVVKEADALAEVGCNVRVVAYRAADDEKLERDRATMNGRRWTLQTVAISRRGVRATARWVLATITERTARQLLRLGVSAGFIRDAAISKHRRALWKQAISEPASLVIAHHAPALPAAARAARVLRAQLAFDAEDLHSETEPDIPRYALERELAASVEAAYLPLCAKITASSPGIADELARRYQVARPVVVLNAFPTAESTRPPLARAPDAPISLYWFSQVIGLDRGLQDVIHALPLVGLPVELHLRGEVDPDVRRFLQALAIRLGVAGMLHFHPLAPPPELTSLAAAHDIGLALEHPDTMNRQLCISNKLMLYLTAGIPVVATDTAGQRVIAQAAPGAVMLYPPGDHAALAAAIKALASSPDALAGAKGRARELGRDAFSWERQASLLVSYLIGTESARADGRRALGGDQ